MIVIDTHALVWMMEGEPQLGRKAREIINAELAAGAIWIAPITLWETAMLIDKGKLALSMPIRAWYDRVLAIPNFVLAELTVDIGADAGTLPGGIHGDPADRLIIATARARDCPVLTADAKILAYAKAGHLQVIDARH
jgi:PIN domain nuclease of toxin-antitoxin system